MTDRCRERVPLRKLIDHLDGELSPRAAGKLDRHLEEGCASCLARVEDLRRTVDSLSAGPLPAPPAALARRAGGLLAKHRRRRTVDRVRRTIATLLFDERLEPAPALRSVPGISRRFLWAAGEVELFVTLSLESRVWRLEGEVMGAGDGPVDLPGEIALVRNGDEHARSVVDAAGRFRFRIGPAGAWVLRGRSGGERFETPPFVL